VYQPEKILILIITNMCVRGPHQKIQILLHELIKIKVMSDERAQRAAILETICTQLDAAPVQHIGKILLEVSGPGSADPR
jgi:cell division septal protein FtsQ